MKLSNKFLQLLVTALSVVLLSFSTVQAETPQEKGRRIMERIDRLPVMEKVLNQISLYIYDSQGKIVFTKKTRGAQYYSDYRDESKRLIRSLASFYAPADDKGNGSLSVEVANGDDDQWIYLKGLRKPKRIIGSDKSSSFMGSDMSNGDMAPKNIDDSNYTWLGSETVNFKGKKIPVEKVRSVFKKKQMKKDYGLSQSVIWIHLKSGLVFKAEQYDLNEQLFKTTRLRSFKVVKNRDRKSVFMMTGSEVTNVMKGTKTVMKMSKIRTGKKAASVRPGIFKTEYLTRRWW
ncbi:MAG: outer membrane lipoprotein-sorting protein [Proteobacteria bacterium]|nr:outer membrane lipoprotein-sorting protein [Pseudomonadota bacterium]